MPVGFLFWRPSGWSSRLPNFDFATLRYMKIEDWRIRIDELNDEIISLLNKRASYATEIGKIKKEQGLPVFDPTREDAVLEKVSTLTKGPLTPESIKNIFRVIMQETRKVEE